MSEVTVIGLGAMGSALARRLCASGHDVTVWNRTPAKADPLSDLGATVAPSAADAVARSGVVIVCVDGYDVTRAILEAPDATAALGGRTLVQLSTGTPAEARDGEQWAIARGATYLDGAILAYPDQIGAPGSVILVAGDEDAWQRAAPLLQSLAGGVTWVGPAVGAASALDCAVLSFLFGAFIGLVHGARICEIEGLSVRDYGAMVKGVLPVLDAEVAGLTARMHEGRFDDTQAALGTYAAAAARVDEHAIDAGIPRDLPAAASALLGRATAAGFGDEDLAALIKIMRT